MAFPHKVISPFSGIFIRNDMKLLNGMNLAVFSQFIIFPYFDGTWYGTVMSVRLFGVFCFYLHFSVMCNATTCL